MKRLKKIIFYCLILFMASCSGQSKNDELNGLYGNKFGQLIYFDNGKMYFYKSTFSHVFQKMEMETYAYKNKQIIYKYDDIVLNYEENMVNSLDHRGRFYKRFKSIEDILSIRNLDPDKMYKRMNSTEEIDRNNFDKALKNQEYLKHTDILVDNFSIDEMINNLLD